ncbi:HAD family phosphatase [Polynucleobacter sp.]|uniref:histidinol-phosphatase n=1 Tax=Polynucleobacter sp. TaxID=2029855 RepID=UPI002732531E|nr:HAD family hydrolase [Polynucleobacter sp.]MDP3121877.1 HAD family hydrolase [Polynucleobacter sp.]
MTQLALFDLDHTLLPFDSDYEWGQFLVRQGVVDPIDYAQKNDQFYADYKLGKLDIDAFLRFALKPLSEHPRAKLQQWHDAFMAEVIIGKLHPAAIALVKRHQDAGDLCCVVTATNSFVTRPIVNAFGISHLVATEPATVNNEASQMFTGAVHGIPSFREGKIQRVHDWLASLGQSMEQMEKSYFYSDSPNDLPLLEVVSHPIATNPDPRLRAEAEKRQWPILELFA